jgi:RNA polymerase sigma-70 factor (ECF subfamily)
VSAALDPAVVERIVAARAAWPDLALADDAFATHLSALAADGLPPTEHAADLWLACACCHGVPGAVESFVRTLQPTIERAVARVDRSLVDEGTQAVFVSLLVHEPGERSRLAGYAGRSSLRAWVAAVAARTTLKLRRRRDDRPHESLDDVARAVAAEEPELAIARARYAPQLDAALRGALAALDDRQRVLLRLHHAEGWSVDRLGETYRVGRSTAARWVADARRRLLEEARAILHRQLQLTATELNSLLVVLQSGVDASLVRLLAREDPATGD